MEILRKQEDGTIDRLHGGFFSARVSQWQSRWLPCEGEALAAKCVLQHFKPQLQNANKTVIHHTDSLPVCQAWQKSKTGAFSTSARIAAFLSEISTLDVEFVHTPEILFATVTMQVGMQRNAIIINARYVNISKILFSRQIMLLEK